MDIKKIKSKINKRLVVTLLLAGICVLLSYLETLIPSFGKNVSYAKITISGAVIIFTLITYGVGESILVMGISALSTGLIINNSPFMILYFLLGGLFLVLTAFGLTKCNKFGIFAVSVLGLIANILGQTIMSSLMLGSVAPFTHFPINALFATISGLLCGAIVYVLIRFLPSALLYSKE